MLENDRKSTSLQQINRVLAMMFCYFDTAISVRVHMMLALI